MPSFAFHVTVTMPWAPALPRPAKSAIRSALSQSFSAPLGANRSTVSGRPSASRLNQKRATPAGPVRNAGQAHMGVGSATGRDKAEQAAQAAVSSPLLETSINGATGVLINIAGSHDLGLDDVETAANIVMEAANPDANIIFGAAFDDELQDEMRVTVIATGFAEKRQSPAKPIGAFSAAQEKASASRTQAQEDIDDIDEIFKIFNRN